ncbi:hypothetical protein T440DRAFT_466838 [Plenodomus tracheiphilus IPT5]|uniref:Membrane-associated proteins in eicosanoid and glutathione metabolism n=1 Tax=Plenodomus tracheiphilus IPT5 TaxID=1408161 RepID=A0A6A7BEB4_9PLEO|nr:hypothetical protein T440DRAFT_466838 [Plenodomus tracheiphilus IPT5]
MVATIQIPSDYGYVLAACTTTLLISTWHGFHVGSFRKAAKIPYPYEYASYEQITAAAPASKAAMLAFNSAQRAHQNFNENHVTMLGAMLISGLRFPLFAAVAGCLWSVNRVVYAVGYSRSGAQGGKGRYYGALGPLAQYVLVLTSVVVAVGVVMG